MTVKPQKLISWGFIVVSIGVALLIAYEVAALIVNLISPPQSAPVVSEAKVQRTTTNSVFRPSPLFGRMNAVARVSNTDKVVKSDLNLTLLGTVLSSNKQLALISQGKATPKLFGIGDALMPGAVLQEVATNFVIYEHQNKRKKLLLELVTHFAPSSATKRTQPTRKRRVSPQLRRRIVKYKRTLNDNPLTLANLFVGRPVMNNGELKGLAIMPGSDPELFNYIGFQENDIVTSINGIAVTDYTQLRALTSKLDNMDNAVVQITRNGAVQELIVNLNP
jgi:type II secretion system protein C